MDLMNISTYLQMVVMGLLLIFAVVMDHFRLSLKGRHR
jgi:ribose/xylose/arabinose/galactoside ABC-type transport system permease subunit